METPRQIIAKIETDYPLHDSTGRPDICQCDLCNLRASLAAWEKLVTQRGIEAGIKSEAARRKWKEFGGDYPNMPTVESVLAEAAKRDDK